MVKSKLQIFMGTAAILCAAGCIGMKKQPASEVDVTNGKAEEGYPFVVKLILNEGGLCTGTFVSDTVVVTAAHCVDKAYKISYNGVSVTNKEAFIHSNWPSQGDACTKVKKDPKFDLALVKFPKGTYKGPYAKILGRIPEVGEKFTIVGYGNNLIQPFEKFCMLPSEPIDGKCQVVAGTRASGAKYDYKSVLSFEPQTEESAVGCPISCSTNRMRKAIENSGSKVEDFILSSCEGNFRDRSYKETGSGEKRSGTNVILGVEDGLISFQGHIGGEDSGIDSASGAGDSGGPLFIEVDGEPRLAATTHGGSLGVHGDDFRKRSMYVVTASEHNMPWLKFIVSAQKLDFPGILP